MLYIAITTILAIILLLVAVYIKKRKAENGSNTAEEQNEVNPVEDNIQKLFELNLDLRLINPDTEILQVAEEVIDKTRILLPVLNEKDKFSELTVTVNRIPTRYLPELIRPYIAVSEGEREALKTDIVKNLKTLSKELDKIQEALDKGEKSEYKRMSLLIDSLFNKTEEGGL